MLQGWTGVRRLWRWLACVGKGGAGGGGCGKRRWGWQSKLAPHEQTHVSSPPSEENAMASAPLADARSGGAVGERLPRGLPRLRS